MAKAPGGIMGRQTGRIGNIVINYAQNKQIIKSRKRKIEDPKSAAQLAQREKYNNAVALYNAGKNALWAGSMFDHDKKLTLYMAVMKLITTHMAAAFPATPSLVLTTHPDPIIFSYMNVTPHSGNVYTRIYRDWERGFLDELDWDYYGMISVPSIGSLFFEANALMWSGSEIRVNFPVDFSLAAYHVHIYLCAVKKDGTIVTGTGYHHYS